MPGAKILVVEDEIIIQADLEFKLKKNGYSVIGAATTGEDAIELARGKRPDIVLMDIILAGEMDGIEAAKIIYGNYKIPIVYITAHSDKKTINKVKTTAPYGYVIKPVNDDDLFSTIEIALYKHKTDKKVEESNELVELIINATNDPIFLLDSQHRILNTNNAVLPLFKLKKDKLIGKKLNDFLTDDISDFLTSKVIEVYEKKKTIKFEFILFKRFFDWSIYPILNNFGDVEKIAIYGRDITERRNLDRNIIQNTQKDLRKIGQILHDSVGQKLTAISYLTQGIKKHLYDMSIDDTDIFEEIDNIVNVSADLIEVVRTISRGMDPIKFGPEGFVNALEDLADETSRIFKIPCSLDVKGEFIKKDKIIITSLFYIVQEAINNAVKHCKTTDIKILLENHMEKIYLSVFNKGTMNHGENVQKGMGIKIMRYRANIIGALFDASSEKDGFSVTVTLMK